MTNSIKTLQKTKGVKKEFSFISKVSDYITKEYGEIEHLLDQTNVREIVDEICEDSPLKGNCLAIYDDCENLNVVSRYDLSYSTIDSNKKGVDNVEVRVYRSPRVSLDEVYYISNIEEYDKFKEEEKVAQLKERIEVKEKALEREKQQEINRQEKVKLDLAIRKEFGLDRNEDTSKAIAYKEFATEVLGKTSDLKNGFIKFKKLVSNTAIDEDRVEEIVNSAIDNHYYDEH